MPTPKLLRLEFSQDELREIGVALSDQLASLIRIDPAVYRRHIDTIRTALAKTLDCIGQQPGDRCFLCRTPIAAADGPTRGRCPNGCQAPGSWLQTQALNAKVH